MPKYMLVLLLLGITAVAVAPASATEDCSILGNIEAAMNYENPELGDWVYTLTLSWNTGTPYALSHFNMILDVEFGECACEDFQNALGWVSPAGFSTGFDASGNACTVDYDLYLECGGDPSVPEIDAPLLKFEPIEYQECEPGPLGEGTFVFYSDYAPAPVADYESFLVDKHGNLACFGTLTGVFPGLPCDPLGQHDTTWGTLKDCYR